MEVTMSNKLRLEQSGTRQLAVTNGIRTDRNTKEKE